MNDPVNQFLLKRLEATQTSWGRFCLSAHLVQQKLRAQWLAHGEACVKRAFDIGVSLTLLMMLSPFLLLIGLAVWIEDGGSILFAQTRVGQFGRLFKMFKTFKLKDDPRMTRVGKWLRKYSFDELPQLYNVLIGDMSLVGPRPPVPREVAKYRLADRRRLAAKPGITCIWQISGRSEIDFSGQVGLDVGYIETQSFWNDLKILVMTVPAVFSGKGAC
jgi:lipopolysaccharide/colanic/teichoic acid biosynthesis glycosyltransferase